MPGGAIDAEKCNTSIGEESPFLPDNGGEILFTSPYDRMEKCSGGGQGGDLYLVLVVVGDMVVAEISFLCRR